MSQENVEIVKRLLWDGVDAAPIVRDDDALADRTRLVWLDFFKPWESLRFEIERIAAQGERVLALARLYGRMAGSDNEVEALFAAVYLVRDGRVARCEFYADRAEAFEAAGFRL